MYKQIRNYENYIIYDDGRLYNTATQIFLKGSITKNGYHIYRLSKNNKKEMFFAHRLVAEYFIDNPNNLPVVNHKDGNKLNNNVDNLEWVSYSENIEYWHKNRSCKQNSPLVYYNGEDLPEEKWKVFGNYMVSSCGRIYNKNKKNFLKPSLTCGYYKVRLSDNGLVSDYMVHKLVWELFMGTSASVPGYVIDHIDGDKLNNCISNLRKISLSDNVKAAFYTQKTNSQVKAINQYDLNGNYIASFPSAREAARKLNLDGSTIIKVCKGKNKTHGGFIFKYAH